MFNCLLMEFWEKNIYSQTFVRNIVLECNHFLKKKNRHFSEEYFLFSSPPNFGQVYVTCGLCLGDITATKLTAIDNLRLLSWRIYGYMFVLSIS